MADVLRRAAAGDPLIDHDLGRERIRACVDGGARSRVARDPDPSDLPRLALAALGLELRPDGLAPRLGRLLVIDVAIDAVVHALRAERLEPRVERAPDRAEVVVARIAEREHREAKLLEVRSSVTHPELEKGLRALGRIAEAVRGDDEDRLRHAPQRLRIEIAKIDELRREAGVTQPLRDRLRDAAAIAGFGRVEDRPRCGRLGAFRGARRRCGSPARGAASGKPREVAARPDQLITVERLDGGADLLDRLEGNDRWQKLVRSDSRHDTLLR